MSCAKASFVIVSLFSALMALGLAGGSIWYSIQMRQLTNLRNVEQFQVDARVRWPAVLPYVFAAVGVFAALVFLTGLCGMKSKGCLITFAFCSALVLLMVVSAAIMAIMLARDNSEKFIKETLNSAFSQVKIHHPTVTKGFHEIESTWHCCGVDVPDVYSWNSLPLPSSCCDTGSTCDTSYRKGCVRVATYNAEWAYYIGVAACSVLAFTTIICVTLAIVLARRKMSSKVTG